MKIISWNVNGLRSVYYNNYFSQIKKVKPDIICLQEIKADVDQLPKRLVKMKRYYSYFNSASRKGYGGVAIYTNRKPSKVNCKIGFKRFDREGRFLELSYPDFILINLYFPHGGRDKSDLAYKLKSFDHFTKYLKTKAGKKIILVGDFNIAHKEIDLARPKQSQNNIMFTPEERNKIDRIIKIGFLDSFRFLSKKGKQYTWWPYFAKARERNLGWRIDYIFISNDLTESLKKSDILKEMMGSDHCPLTIRMRLKSR